MPQDTENPESNDVNIRTSVSLIPENYYRMKELVKNRVYPSNASVVNSAMTTFFALRDDRERLRLAAKEEPQEMNTQILLKALEAFIQSEEGVKAIEDLLKKEQRQEKQVFRRHHIID